MTVDTVPGIMEINGRFERGQVILDKQPALPEGVRLHVRITVEKNEEAVDDNGWPLGFFEETAGSCPDLERPPQGEYEIRESLE